MLAVAAAAQSTVVLPASHGTQEGSSSTNVPFGRSTPTRVQCCYDAANFGGPITVQSVAFRIDGGATAAAKTVDCELRMSTMPGGLLALNADFAANRGLDETVVLPRQVLALPAHTTAAVPSPFGAAIQLATPFAFDPAQGSLLVEIVVHGQPPGA
ncbi:MAG: hypothetical protein RL398_3064, partial [Planctomycetota bacterium]